MADKYLAKGTVSAVASGNMSPTNPASLAVDDVLVCFVAHHDNVTPTISGWTAITDNGWPAASGTAVRIDAFWKRVANASESDDVVTVTRAAGDAGIAIITAFRGLTTTGNPYNAADAQANASSTTLTMLTVTPSAAGQTIIFAGAHADDGAYGAISGTDPAPTERHDSLTSLGLDVCLLVGTGERSVSTAVGNRTSTNNRTAVNVGGQIALTNASGSTVVEADGSSSGVAASAVVGAALWLALSSAAGIGAASGVGVSFNKADAAAVGVASASADGEDSAAGSDAASSGTSSVGGIGAAVSASASAATGVGSASSVGAATTLGTGSAGGTATVNGVAFATTTADGTATGAATSTGIGAALFAASGVSAGVGAGSADGENGSGAAPVEADASAAGTAAVAANSARVLPGVGVSAAAGLGDGTSPPILLIGTRFARRVSSIIYEWLQ